MYVTYSTHHDDWNAQVANQSLDKRDKYNFLTPFEDGKACVRQWNVFGVNFIYKSILNEIIYFIDIGINALTV